MFTTKEELKTHMNIDSIDVITGSDDTLVTSAIDGAISEAKGYLTAFDVATLFAATGSDRHSLLLTFVKDMAVWHLMALSNYQADLELREKRYDRAIAWLKAVQKGDVVPDLPASAVALGKVIYGSNPKREQHF